jgi:transcriptional regulator with XRE-family HTH domain
MEPTNGLIDLARVISKTREEKGMSMRKLAEAAGLTHSFIAKLEGGQFQSVSLRSLDSLAGALELPREDLFSLAGYNVPKELPTFAPYLRARYGTELPDHAMTALNELFEALREKYTGTDEIDDETEQADVHEHLGGRS